MSVKKVNKTTGATTKVAGLVNSEKVNTMYGAFPSDASASNKLVSNATADEKISDESQVIFEVMGRNGAKNLLPIKYSKITTYGLTWEKLNDGSVIMNGTSTASPAQQSLFDATPSTITSGSGTIISLKELGIDGTKKYIFSRDTKIANVRPRIDLWSDSAKLLEVELSNNDGLYKEIDFSQYPTCIGIKATIQITLNTTVTNAIQKMMLCSKEWYDVDPTYQPYAETNQQLTADTADKVSWDDLSKVGAVNFLKYPYLDSNKASSEIIITDNGDGTISFAAGTVSSSSSCTFWFERYATGMSAIDLRGKTIKFSVDLSEGLGFNESTARIEFSIADNTDTVITGTNHHVPLTNNHNEWIVNVPSNADHFTIMLWIAKNTVLPSFTLSPMITVASYNGDYVPYAKSNRELTEDTASAIANITNGAINLAKPNSAGTTTVSDVEFVIDSEGKVTTNGTASANIRFDMAEVTLKAGRTYKICEPSSLQARRPFNPETYRCYARIKSSGTWVLQNNGWKRSYTPTEDVVVSVGIAMQSGNQVTDEIFAPMLVLDGTDVGDTFYPYAMTNRELTKVQSVQRSISQGLTLANSFEGWATLKLSGYSGIIMGQFVCKSATTDLITFTDLPSYVKTQTHGIIIRDNNDGSLIKAWVNNQGGLSTYLHDGTMTVGHTYAFVFPVYTT